jgi:phospholipid transport system transporter-binding protein
VIQITQTGPNLWLLEGELTFATVSELLTNGPGIDPTKHAVVDLSRLTKGDSAGLSLIIEWAARARARGGTVEYIGLRDDFARLARVADLDFLNADLKRRNSSVRIHSADGFPGDLAL